MEQLEIIELYEQSPEYKCIQRCINIAKQSTCERSRCGSVIYNPVCGGVFAEGFNSQPCGATEPCFKDSLPANFKSDKTCCIHAEQRAILNAHGQPCLKGSVLYFVRLDKDGNPEDCGEPYCTICSKMALDAGIARFVLYHSQGLRSYDTKYYNELSFQYKP